MTPRSSVSPPSGGPSFKIFLIVATFPVLALLLGSSAQAYMRSAPPAAEPGERLPDLIVWNRFSHTVPGARKDYASVGVKNVGEGPAKVVDLNIFLDQDRKFDGMVVKPKDGEGWNCTTPRRSLRRGASSSNRPISTNCTSSVALQPGEIRTITLELEWNPSLTKHERFTVAVHADPVNRIAESDKSNNLVSGYVE